MLLKDDTEGKYLKFHHAKLRASINDDQFKEFASLQTNEARFRYVYGLPAAHEFPIKDAEFKKDGARALDLKNEGNKVYQSGNYYRSLELYNKSISISPWTKESWQELSIVLANRSAVLYHLKEYMHSLEDIKLALSLNYPLELHYKVLDRKARCLLATQQLKDAQKAFQDTLTALDKSKLAEGKRLKWQKDIQVMLAILVKNKEICNAPIPEISNIFKPLPAVTGSPNEQYTSASSAVQIEYKEGAGRYAEAGQNLNPGELILAEKAYCSVLLAEHSKTHCFHCFKRLVAPVPCSSCDQVFFCSSACQEAALSTHHRTECKILHALWESGASVTCLMALRMLTQNKLEYFINMKGKLLKYENKPSKKNIYRSSDYANVYNLVSHDNRRTPEDFFHRAGMAVFLFRCLKKTNYFNEEPGKQELGLSVDEEFIGGLLLHHLQLLQFNAHEISELQLYKGDKLMNSKTAFLGGGLYPTLALFNHSCDPGVIRYFHGSSVVVRTIKSIRKGEMIAENYGPIFTQVHKTERQNTLKSQYWFDCSCIPCIENWPRNEEMDTSILRFHCDAGENSRECKNVVIVHADTPDFMVQCSSCKGYTNIMKGLKILQDTDSMFHTAKKLLESDDIKKALTKFLEILTLLDKTLAPPFRDYHLCQENIRQCFLSFGNKHYKKMAE